MRELDDIRREGAPFGEKSMKVRDEKGWKNGGAHREVERRCSRGGIQREDEERGGRGVERLRRGCQVASHAKIRCGWVGRKRNEASTGGIQWERDDEEKMREDVEEVLKEGRRRCQLALKGKMKEDVEEV